MHCLTHTNNTHAGEYVALEALETHLAGGASDFINNGCIWAHADSTKRRLVLVVVPNKDA